MAVALLRLHFGCTIAAMEEAGLGNYENRHKDWEGFKHIADAVGIKECKRWVPPKGERAKGYYKTRFHALVVWSSIVMSMPSSTSFGWDAAVGR